MKTILWKELREHARWVPLGAIAMIVVLVLKWQSTELIFDAPAYGNSMRLGSLVALVASGIAICLGLLQSWPDQRPAARALLLHRGITANTVFWGKLLAGLLLYGIAVFVPLLGMAFFIASAGLEHRAASPGALLPSAFVAMAAFSCWPASMLVVQRDVRFWGSRLSSGLSGITAGLAVLGCGAVMYEVFWLACTIAATTLVGFVATARSVFVSGSQDATGVGRVGLAIGVGVSLFTMTVFSGGFVESFRSVHNVRMDSYNVVLGEQGLPWVVRLRYSSRARTSVVAQVANMATGRSVRENFEPAGDDWGPLRSWAPMMFVNIRDTQTLVEPRFVLVGDTVVEASGGTFERLQWVLNTRDDVLLVYRSASSNRHRYELASTLLAPAPSESFGRHRSHAVISARRDFLTVSTTGVFLSSEGSRVDCIYAIPNRSRLLGSAISTFRPSRTDVWSESKEGFYGMMLYLSDRVVLLEHDLSSAAESRAELAGDFPGLGEVFATELHLPSELASYNVLRIARDPMDDEAYVGVGYDLLRPGEKISWFRFNQDGTVKQREQYTDDFTPDFALTGIEMAALMPPCVYAFGWGMIAIEIAADSDDVQEAWEHVKAKAKAEPTTAALVILLGLVQPLIGIPLAIWAARRRRLDRRTTRRWIWWGFFCGPYGSFAILAVYPRVAREPCSACQKATRTDVANCEHCQHSLDDLTQTGIEIFDQLQAIPATSTQPAST